MIFKQTAPGGVGTRRGGFRALRSSFWSPGRGRDPPRGPTTLTRSILALWAKNEILKIFKFDQSRQKWRLWSNTVPGGVGTRRGRSQWRTHGLKTVLGGSLPRRGRVSKNRRVRFFEMQIFFWKFSKFSENCCFDNFRQTAPGEVGICRGTAWGPCGRHFKATGRGRDPARG